MHNSQRRQFLRQLAAAGLTSLAGPAVADKAVAKAHVVVIGAGFGGSTCARYLKLLEPRLNVTLIDPQRTYVTCPMSNLVLTGLHKLSMLRVDRQTSAHRLAIRMVYDSATTIDFKRRLIKLQHGHPIHFDRLVMAPGIDFKWNSPQGYDRQASRSMPHAWKAGPQTEQLFNSLKLMPNGGVVAISVPASPFRCPPGPYERASLIAYYLHRHKPRSKVLLLDANDKFSKQPLFQEGWQALYPGLIEWIPISKDGAVRRVGVKSLTLFTELERHKVDVANVIPAQYAAAVARNNGLADDSGWCPVQPGSFASTLMSNVYVIGDAVIADPMPKSATSANSQAKQCALAALADLNGLPPPSPSLHNTCYSLIDPDYGISINASYKLDNSKLATVAGAGGISPPGRDATFREREARYAKGWYDSIVRDSFGTR